MLHNTKSTVAIVSLASKTRERASTVTRGVVVNGYAATPCFEEEDSAISPFEVEDEEALLADRDCAFVS